MSNQYFTPTPFSRHTLARAEALSSEMEAVKVGFDKLPDPAILTGGKVTYAVESGTGNAYVVAMPTALTAYVVGQEVVFAVSRTNTGPATLNVDGLGARAIKRANGADLKAGDLAAGTIAAMRFNGTSFLTASMIQADVQDVVSAAATATAQAGIATSQAGVATTQAGIATTKAGEAAASQSTASTAAGTATTKAGEAAASQGAASTSAGTATTQAGVATTQAGISTTQAGVSTTKAGESAASALVSKDWAESPTEPDGADTMSSLTAAGIAVYAALDAKDSIEDAQAWAEGTEPGGPGTKSAQEWAGESEGYADNAAISETNAADSAVESALYDPTLRYKTRPSMLASNRTPGTSGTVWQAGDQLFEEAPLTATDHDYLTSPGGVKLYDIQKQVFYVDPVTGSDSNTGRSEATAYATLSAVPRQDGVHVRVIATEANLREEFDFSDYDNVTIEGWGDFVANGIPKIRGDDVVAGTWASVGSAYSISWTHSIQIGARNLTPCLFEDGEMLNFATSLANCQATPGTFWHDMPVTGAAVTIYVHPTGSTNPNSDGKTYEITKRHEVVRVGDNSTVRWLHCHAAGNTLGSVVHGHNCKIENVLLTGNPLHSLNGGSGLRRRVVGYQPVAFPNEGGLILEHYIEDSKRKTIRNEQCVAIGPALVGAQDIGGFGGHDAEGGGLERIEYIDCACRNATMDTEAQFVRIERPNMQNGSMLFAARNDGGLPEVEVIDPKMTITALATGGTARKYLMAVGGYAAGLNPKLTVEGLRLYANVNWSAAFNSPANVVVTGSVIVLGSSATGGGLVNAKSVAQQQNAIVTHNIIQGVSGNQIYDVRNYDYDGGTFEADYNLIYPLSGFGAGMTYRGPDGAGGHTAKYSLADVQATFGLEMNSAEGDPGIADAASGDFRYTSNGSIPGCGLARPNVKYTPILNSEAESLEWLIYGEVS